MILYHVTFTSNVFSILASGIKPTEARNWVGSQDGRDMGDGSKVYAFTDLLEAHKWAEYQKEQFNAQTSVIVFLEDAYNWDFDISDCPTLADKAIIRLCRPEPVEAKQIIGVYNGYGTRLSKGVCSGVTGEEKAEGVEEQSPEENGP